MKNMTNFEILNNALKKAEKSGFQFKYWHILDGYRYTHSKEERKCQATIIDQICDNGAPIEEMAEYFNVLNLIFSHDFAKAFWGEKEIIRMIEEKKE